MSRLVADTRIKFEATFKDQDGTLIDLTDSTVLLRYKVQSISAPVTVTEKAASITDAAGGVAEYVMADDELVAGLLEYEWQVTDGAGKVFIQDEPFYRTVRAELT
jgi:hypothetical protein